MADVTYYVALPFLQDDTGELVAGAAEECQSATTALRRAEMMSRIPGSIGAVAFSRSGDPMMGEFGDAHLLRKFGNVPEDLSGLYSAASRHRCGRRSGTIVHSAPEQTVRAARETEFFVEGFAAVQRLPA